MNEDKATRYHRQKRLSQVAGTVAGSAALLAFWWSGASVLLRVLCERGAVAAGLTGAWGQTAVVLGYVAVFCVAAEVMALPLAAYRGHVLDRRYGLSTQGWGRWLIDHLKASALGLILALAASSVAYAALRGWPRGWWILTSAAFAAGAACLVFVAPVCLFPMFFRLRPLDREGLARRLADLAARAGSPVLGVYEWGLGDRSRAANAALVGLARTRRILVSDTLLSGYSDEEIEVVLAHELAHHVHGDLWKALGLDALLTAGALAASHLALSLATASGQLPARHDIAGLPLLLGASAAWSLLTIPLVNGLSRRHERRADRFALDLTANPEAFMSAMRRLGAQNLAEPAPSAVTEWLFHSHPPLPERIAAARAWVPAAGRSPAS